MFSYNEDVLYHINNNIFMELKISTIHGVGTYLVKDVSEGTELAKPWTGDSGLYDVPFNLITSDVQPLIWRFFCYRTSIEKLNSNKEVIKIHLYTGLNFLHHSHAFINHSHVPNIDYGLVSMTSIKKGEELFRNYYNTSPFVLEKNII